MQHRQLLNQHYHDRTINILSEESQTQANERLKGRDSVREATETMDWV